METGKRGEFCVSFDVVTQSIAFYSVESKNRIRYNQYNCKQLLNVVPMVINGNRVHWPRNCNAVKSFVQHVNYLAAQRHINLSEKELGVRNAWNNIWQYMGKA
jgi:hypothetical protein